MAHARLTDERQAIIETVRVRVLRMLEADRSLTYPTIGKKIGCDPEYLGHFLRGECVSFTLAERLARGFGQVGEGIVCRECGRIREGS